MGFIRKLYGAFSRKADKITLFQVKAMEKADRISKGEKMPAPLYPSEEKILKRLAKDDERIKQIREKIDKKDETLIGNVEEITITSTDPLEHSKSKRELPKRPWEYEHDSKQDYKYGFYEPPVGKIETNKLMFREALEILRARMELESHSEKMRESHKANEILKSHPAVKRVDKEKLDTIWEFFRPFADKREQTLAPKYDLDMIQKFIEGADNKSGRASFITQRHQTAHALNRIKWKEKVSVPNIEVFQQLQEKEKKEAVTFQQKVTEKQEKETKRLDGRLKELREMEEEEAKLKGKKGTEE